MRTPLKYLIPIAFLLSTTALAATAEELTLIHGIPGEDLGLDNDLPVDTAIGHRCIATTVPYQTVADGIPVHPGIPKVTIRLANAHRECRGQELIQTLVPISFGENATVMANLMRDGTITATKFTNDLQTLPEVTDARVTVRHTANAPAVDIGVDGNVLFSDLSNGEQGYSARRQHLSGLHKPRRSLGSGVWCLDRNPSSQKNTICLCG